MSVGKITLASVWKTDQMGLAGGKQAVLGGLEVSREEVMVMRTSVVTAGMESKYRMRKRKRARERRDRD